MAFSLSVGYHTKNTVKEHNDMYTHRSLNLDDQNSINLDYQNEEKIYKKIACQRNLGNLLGYLPGLGIIAGAARIHKGYTNLKNERSPAHRCQCGYLPIVRGTTEIAGIGIIWLIPDLIASIRMHARKPQVHVSEPNDFDDNTWNTAQSKPKRSTTVFECEGSLAGSHFTTSLILNQQKASAIERLNNS
ncbi:MAG: hypothetical protein R3E91_05320 [Chlamydiales bacterium]